MCEKNCERFELCEGFPLKPEDQTWEKWKGLEPNPKPEQNKETLTA